jgi:hypothetical protein
MSTDSPRGMACAGVHHRCGFSHADGVRERQHSQVRDLGHSGSGALPLAGTYVLPWRAGCHRGACVVLPPCRFHLITEGLLISLTPATTSLWHGPYGWARSGGGGGGSPSTGTLHCCANVGAWQRLQYFVLRTAPAQPSFWQRLPPPCPLQNFVLRTAPFAQPSFWQRAPPPCPLQNSVLPRACFVQPCFQLHFRARGFCAIAPTHRLLV